MHLKGHEPEKKIGGIAKMIKKLLSHTTLVIGLVVVLVLAGSFSYALGQKDKTKDLEMGYLGVYVEEMSGQDKVELKADFGVMVTKVIPDSAAGKAGLKRYDVIQYFAGEKMRRAADLTDDVRAKKPGDKVLIKLVREGKNMDVEVVLGEFTGKESAFFYETMPFNEEDEVERRHFEGKDLPFVYVNEKRVYLGVNLLELNEDLAGYFGVKIGEGVLVIEVSKDSPALKAGLKAGDVILSLEKKKVASTGDIHKVLEDKKKGDKVAIEVMRHQKPLTVNAELDEREPFADFNFFKTPGANWQEKGAEMRIRVPRVTIRHEPGKDGNCIIIKRRGDFPDEKKLQEIIELRLQKEKLVKHKEMMEKQKQMMEKQKEKMEKEKSKKKLQVIEEENQDSTIRP